MVVCSAAPKEYLMHSLFFMHFIFGGFLVWTGVDTPPCYVVSCHAVSHHALYIVDVYIYIYIYIYT